MAFICLQLDTPGGDPAWAITVAAPPSAARPCAPYIAGRTLPLGHHDWVVGIEVSLGYIYVTVPDGASADGRRHLGSVPLRGGEDPTGRAGLRRVVAELHRRRPCPALYEAVCGAAARRHEDAA